MSKSIPVPVVSTFEGAYPNSKKVFDGVVPFREVSLSGGEPPL